MFAGQPQPVEIHHRGIWYSGELIGWRHELDGRVTARVRCRVDGLRHAAWMDLTDLRLPDPKRPPRKEPFPAVVRRPPVNRPTEDDATKPHTLLAALRTGPTKPAHVTRPPSSRPAVGAPRDLPRRPEPVERDRRRLDRREASLSAV
jgi:hypothetical protein